MKTTQLANGFATQIEGVDLSSPLDNDTLEIIRNLWMENRIVVFLEQKTGRRPASRVHRTLRSFVCSCAGEFVDKLQTQRSNGAL
jgi:hypothetical protein